MQLTLHADYALRVLLYLAANPGRLISTKEISDAYQISANHLVKVMLNLNRFGYVRSWRGRTGGNELAVEPEKINLGEILRLTEPDFRIVECFDPKQNTCPIDHHCGLKTALIQACHAFFEVMDRYTLADIMGNSDNFNMRPLAICLPDITRDIEESAKRDRIEKAK